MPMAWPITDAHQFIRNEKAAIHTILITKDTAKKFLLSYNDKRINNLITESWIQVH